MWCLLHCGHPSCPECSSPLAHWGCSRSTQEQRYNLSPKGWSLEGFVQVLWGEGGAMLLNSTSQILFETQDHASGTGASVTLGTGGGMKQKLHSSSLTIFSPVWLQPLCFSPLCAGSESRPQCFIVLRDLHAGKSYVPSLSLLPSPSPSLACAHTGRPSSPPLRLSRAAAAGSGSTSAPPAAPAPRATLRVTHSGERCSSRGCELKRRAENTRQSNGNNVGDAV